MKLSLFTGLILILLQNVPFKPKEEFEIKLQYEFRQRQLNDAHSIHVSESEKDRERRTSTANLPYVVLKIKFLKLNEKELRVRILDSKGQAIHNKKAKLADPFELILGFTDDMKDRVTSHEYTLLLIDEDRKEQSRITIFIGEDGMFLVNDEKRGKF